MPKWPCSSGPRRNVFAISIKTSSAAQNAPQRYRGHGEKCSAPRVEAARRIPVVELNGVGGGEESADLVRIFNAGTAFDARGDVDCRGAGNAHRFRQQLGGEAARQ